MDLIKNSEKVSRRCSLDSNFSDPMQRDITI